MLVILQPVSIQSFIDEFSIISNENIEIPTSSGELFSPVPSRNELNEKEEKRRHQIVVFVKVVLTRYIKHYSQIVETFFKSK
jgi:hypothetical protein